jgi:group I intron endonuclease
MSSGIYKITNPEGEIYIGCTNNLKKRIGNYKIGKIPTQPLMLESLVKFGWDSHKFEILEYTDNLVEREKYYIQLYNSYNKGLNANRGGGGVETHTQKTKNLISEKGRANKGKRAVSHRKGKILPEYMVKANKDNKGKREVSHWKGKTRSEESKQKMSQSKKGKPNPFNNKPILQFDKQGIFIQEHPSIKAASEIVKGNQSAIHNALKKGKGATSSSYIWKYKE